MSAPRSTGGPMSTHTWPSGCREGCIIPGKASENHTPVAGSYLTGIQPGETRPEFSQETQICSDKQVELGQGGQLTCKCVYTMPARAIFVNLCHKLCQAPDAVATHFWLTAIRVVDPHAVVNVFSFCRKGKDDLHISSFDGSWQVCEARATSGV